MATAIPAPILLTSKTENWLELLAVYFDRMYRIAPEPYRLEGSDTVETLEEFVDFVRPDLADPDFGDRFAKLIGM